MEKHFKDHNDMHWNSDNSEEAISEIIFSQWIKNKTMRFILIFVGSLAVLMAAGYLATRFWFN